MLRQPGERDMTLSPSDLEMIRTIRAELGGSRRLVFISGIFNVVHSGHLRLLNFAAECGDFLVVGVHRDGVAGCVVPQHLRLESTQSISVVDCAFIMESSVEQIIAGLRPDVVVKGKEYEEADNPEQAIVDEYGGKLLFGSADVRFSSLELLRNELSQLNLSTVQKPLGFLERHKFTLPDLEATLAAMAKLNVLVVGDLIVDEYVTCEPLGMSQEDPTIVVTPLASERFIGGAGIVAAHARGLGARSGFVSVVGEDDIAAFAAEKLGSYGVEHHLIADPTRPTTLKKRYRAREKTLLRVNHLRQHEITKDLIASFLERAIPLIEAADLVIFSDFNYGCLPQSLVDAVGAHCGDRGIMMAADSQASSQFSDVSRFRNMRLVTPTEREARLAVRDFSSGLVQLTSKLQAAAAAENVLMTLGSEGVFIQTSGKPGPDGLLTDRLPAMNTAPRDVAGGGDSMLVGAAMALAVGAPIWPAAYIGSLAAACQVGRVGNVPLRADELIEEIRL